MISGVLLSGTMNIGTSTCQVTNIWGPLSSYVYTGAQQYSTSGNSKIFTLQFSSNLKSYTFQVFATAHNNKSDITSNSGAFTYYTSASDTRVVEYLGVKNNTLLFIVSDGGNARATDCNFDFMLVGDITKVLTVDLL